MSKSTVLSCIQPTSEMHFGNYFGAVKNWVELQDKYDCIYGVVDYHAMTMPYEPELLRHNTMNMVADLLACGVDPEKSTLFIQSLVPEHAELAWILGCYCSYGELQRMTQFKDKSESDKVQEKGNIVSTGLFTYPILQAADILIYLAEYVPVGKDQEQHLELSRNIANRFNNKHGDFFVEPKALFTEIPKLLSLADPSKKMSKSLGDQHVVRLFEEEASIRKKVKTAVTDTGPQTAGVMSPGVANLFELVKACGNMEAYTALTDNYNSGTLKYSELKQVVADGLVALSKEFIERKAAITANTQQLTEQVHEMSSKARKIARATIHKVREL
ncbi:MAG: tryptophan--tRNA ligase, partial [Dinghuibacter sp.]|nr:tryptophan--tRNA ligase [Dinghuibacter sp.]